MRSCPTIQAYVARRTAEGKSPKEIRRCLKRYIARQLHRTLTAAMTPPPPTARTEANRTHSSNQRLDKAQKRIPPPPAQQQKFVMMLILRSIALFALAALCEIGGAWPIWQGIREHRGWLWIVGGVLALGAYGFIATAQPDAHFGRILAAYGGIFVAGSLAWGVVADGYRPDRADLLGALICLVGVAVIMYAPRH